jgi:hypothetical protein
VSPDQQEFVADCEQRGLLCRNVYSAREAIRVIEEYDVRP